MVYQGSQKGMAEITFSDTLAQVSRGPLAQSIAFSSFETGAKLHCEHSQVLSRKARNNRNQTEYWTLSISLCMYVYIYIYMYEQLYNNQTEYWTLSISLSLSVYVCM